MEVLPLNRRTFVPTAIILAFLALALSPTAAAHASANSTDGKVRITWGLLEEPGFTNEKTRLDLIIRDATTMAGIGGILPANITELSLHYGEEEYSLGNITLNRGVKSGAFAGPGNYTSANFVYLTRPGIYTLHIKGTIEGSEVDLEIPAAHEYESMSEIMFPGEIEIGAEPTDTSALEARIAKLETDLAALKAELATQSQTPATLTPQPSPEQNDAPAAGILLVAVAAIGAALVLRRK